MSEERLKVIVEGLQALLDKEAETLKEEISRDNVHGVRISKENIECIDQLITPYYPHFSSSGKIFSFYKKYREIKREAADYLAKKDKKPYTQVAFQGVS